MKLNLCYDQYNLSSTITVPLTIKEILSSMESQLNLPPSSYTVIDESNEILSESEIILPDITKTKNIYMLRKNPSLTHISKIITVHPLIEDLIMKVTDAKEKIQILPPKPELRSGFMYDQLSGTNFDTLLSLLNGYEYQSNNAEEEEHNIEPNENHVKELKEMGFPEERARDALIRARNDISRATEILLGGEEDNNNNEENENDDDNNHN